MNQGGSEDSLFGRLPADRRLCSRRSGPSVSLDFPWIAIPRQRCEFFPRRGTEQPLERPSRCLCQLPDSKHADLGQTRLGFVDGNPLNEGREIADHLDGGIVQPLVVAEMAADKSELRTEFACLPSWHAAVDPEGLCHGNEGGIEKGARADRVSRCRNGV